MKAFAKGSDTRHSIRTVGTAMLCILFVAFSGCTGQLPNSFRFLQQYENFASTAQVNTKIDLLWVIGNSAGMDTEQATLRAGLANFANSYLKTYWDIRIGVITTDVYLADPSFANYLNQPLPNAGQSAHLKALIDGRITAIGSANVGTDSVLQNLAQYFSITQDGTEGTLLLNGSGHALMPLGELVPAWMQGLNYAKLKAGIHDGPNAGFCGYPAMMPYFEAASITDCELRDNAVTDLASTEVGTANCLNTSDNGEVECVNTFNNNSVRSGMPIISTQTPVGHTDAQWAQTIADNFTINSSVGSVGMGSPRGMSSVIEFININEADPTTQFFRQGSLRGIVFLSDRDDQSEVLPTAPAQTTPFAGYGCDLASLIALNPGSAANIEANFCCSGTDGSGNPLCAYGQGGTTCPTKVVDGTDWTATTCPTAGNLIPVATVKTAFDNFFLALDGNTGVQGANPNYFVAAIVPQSLTTLQTLQAARQTDDTNAGQYIERTVDRGDRYLNLVTLVGNGSLALELGDSDYDTLLTEIGEEIVAQKSTFVLASAPAGYTTMTVVIVHVDGTYTVLTPSQYSISGNVLTITDSALVLSLTSTDTIAVDYQPAAPT